MLTSELDYQLPESLIATQPAEPRDAARLLVVRRASEHIEHFHVRDLPTPGVPGLLRAGDLMVFNQTRVLPALISGTRRATGGKVRGLYLASPQPGHWLLMLETRGTLQEDERIELDDQAALRLVASAGGGQWLAELTAAEDTLALLERIGATPLPPYIRKQRRQHHEAEVCADDAQRYNTVYAQAPGSVAAPTAGLHFTPALLDSLERMGVRRAFLTLHVGLGTFAPVRTERVEDHPIHSEHIEVPAATLELLRQTRAAGGRIIPVGTTSVRALESLPDPLPATDYRAATRLFITPSSGPDQLVFPFRFTDALMTNFHLPRSTLLALVAALPGVGIDRLRGWYSAAIEQRYRFYSYGDAMWID